MAKTLDTAESVEKHRICVGRKTIYHSLYNSYKMKSQFFFKDGQTIGNLRNSNYKMTYQYLVTLETI